MVKKRIIGVVAVRQGWAVQSFSYRRYLPLGHPQVLVENFDRWGADEILINCIDRDQLGPDFSLIASLGALGLSTPLIYGGGIRNSVDASEVIKMGADRVLLDTMLWECPDEIKVVSQNLGTQAVIANLPVHVKGSELFWLNYRTNRERHLSERALSHLPLEFLSEMMLTDWKNEGMFSGFDKQILELSSVVRIGLIIFGGLSDPTTLKLALAHPNVAAVGLGNFLSYKEDAIQGIKKVLVGDGIREALRLT